MSILRIVLPRKPLTVNHIYGQAKNGRRFIKEEGQLFKLEIQDIMRGKSLPYDETKHFIRVECYFYLSNFYTKKGLINKKSGDEDNFKKLLLDSIFQCLKIDDSSVCETSSIKTWGKDDMTVVIISTGLLSSLSRPDIS